MYFEQLVIIWRMYFEQLVIIWRMYNICDFRICNNLWDVSWTIIWGMYGFDLRMVRQIGSNCWITWKIEKDDEKNDMGFEPLSLELDLKNFEWHMIKMKF